MLKNNSKAAFSFIELSGTILILGLLAVFILSGRSLYENYQIKALANDISIFESAIESFRTKYNAYPGDINNAYSIFGSKCADSSNNCDSTDYNNLIDRNETIMAWKHLEVSGFIDQRFEQIVAPSLVVPTITCELGRNLPVASYGEAVFTFDNSSNTSFTTMISAPGQLMQIGSGDGAGLTACGTNGLFTAEFMWNLDKKYDDSLAFDGKYLNTEATTNGCSNTADDDYDLSRSGENLCTIFIDI